jgi:hypothetical protein
MQLLCWPTARPPDTYLFKFNPGEGVDLRVGIATDHGGFGLKEELVAPILAVNAHETLVAERIRSRDVSVLSEEIFDHQPEDYQDSVLPPAVKARVAVWSRPRP